MEDITLTPTPAGGLRCVIQPGWGQVDYPGLLREFERRAQQDGLDTEALAAARRAAEADGLMLMLLRLRSEDAIADLLSVALPPEPAADRAAGGLQSAGEGAPAVSAGQVNPEVGVTSDDRTAVIEFAGGTAIVHDDSDTALGGKLTLLQLVMRIQPSERGAVVTALSTEQDCQELLLDEAVALAESLRIEPLQPASSN